MQAGANATVPPVTVACAICPTAGAAGVQSANTRIETAQAILMRSLPSVECAPSQTARPKAYVKTVCGRIPHGNWYETHSSDAAA